jgi:hypothetical protein
MTVYASWRSWTYIVIGRDVASAGLIIELDFPNRIVKYLRRTENWLKENPFPLGSDEHRDFLYDTVIAKYDHIWIDPQRRIVKDRADFDLLQAAKKPPSFLELMDTDPREYFSGRVEVVSTYLSPELLQEICSENPEVEDKNEK